MQQKTKILILTIILSVILLLSGCGNATPTTAGTTINPNAGTVWTVQQNNAPLHAIAKGAGGNLVAVGLLGTILTSQNGINWTSQISGTANILNDITWSGTEFVAVGEPSIIGANGR